MSSTSTEHSSRGAPPDLAELNGDCAFLPRCAKAINACRTEPWPALTEAGANHVVACYNPMYYATAS
jgi:ABC-type dipeptide/oligopeptide/nickel transport system ATPase component